MLKRLGRTIRVRVRGRDHVVEKNGDATFPVYVEAQLLREAPEDWKKADEEKSKPAPIGLPDGSGKFASPPKKGGRK